MSQVDFIRPKNKLWTHFVPLKKLQHISNNIIKNTSSIEKSNVDVHHAHQAFHQTCHVQNKLMSYVLGIKNHIQKII